MKRFYNFRLEDVNKTLILKSWWAAFAILPLARRITLFLANYTNVSPNAVTSVSIFLRFLSMSCFITASRASLIYGAIFFEMAYLSDCVDGPLARLTNKTSAFGRYYDHLTDLAGGVLILGALAFGQGIFFTPIIIAMISVQVAEYYITYLANLVLERKGGGAAGITNFASNRMVKAFLKYRETFFRKNFKSFLSLPDYEALVFFVFPIMGLAVLGIKIGFYLLIIVTVYKVFSSFVTIHTHTAKFP